jgi:hypothetical protein
MEAHGDGQEANFEIQVPAELEGGTYANFLSVWHSAFEFTLDFAVTQPPVQDENGFTVPCRVVARMKIPPTLVFNVIRTLNENMTRYEQVFGPIQEPQAPQEEPDA